MRSPLRSSILAAGAVLCIGGVGAAAVMGLPSRAAEPQGHTLAVASDSFLYLVFSNSAEGREQEYGDWYDSHMASLARLPGFVSAQRFKVRSRAGRADPAFRFVTIYEIKGDPDAALAQIGPATKAGQVVPINNELAVKFENMLYGPVKGAVTNPAVVAAR